jgi:hypothetical protein
MIESEPVKIQTVTAESPESPESPACVLTTAQVNDIILAL